MIVSFETEAHKDYIGWAKENMKTFDRINKLIDDITRSPFKGLGNPEPLKFNLKGLWSRRIDNQNRIIYRVVNKETILIVKCKGHYYD